MRWLPVARSSRWWLWAGVSALMATLLLWIIRFGFLGQSFTGDYAIRFLLLGTGVSFLFGFFGWLGLRKLALCSTAGLAAGLIGMVVYSRDMNGWEDLASILFFMEAIAAGFVIGLIVEGISLMVRLAKK
ncbi:hypothetical protein [Paenibacillus harenae]|uniref:hypothetical protein n=1 Tax=Paenibacillus harenae TaxID=306543 RepID=UPI00278F0C99|nr:hypothetical protein [Paenibacillus harenae]MDQ0062226.1 hypothetical protein [Paenibacillus harenae]